MSSSPEERAKEERERAAYSALVQAELMFEETTKSDPLMAQRQFDLAVARTTIGMTMRSGGNIKIEESVYGAAIVMPQIARTSGWNKTLTIGAIRSWMFLLVNIFLQAYLLKMISKEQSVMDLFGGQMNLCDFGATMEDCPTDSVTPGDSCRRGPGGSVITAPRMYDWDSFVNRHFVKDSLKALFPDKIQEINEKVDPGEYGVESYWCRFACCFIFMIACMSELVTIYKMAELHIKVPTKAEPWIEARPITGERLTGAMEEVRITIAGMPLLWKLINLAGVIVPKFMLWKLTTEVGITFLMDTSGIADIVINSVGLTFILGLDELICAALMNEETSNVCKATEDFPLFDAHTSCVGDMAILTEDEILQKYREAQHGFGSVGFWDAIALIPGKLIMSVLFTCLFVGEYYLKHCTPGDEDQLVSKTMYQPKTAEYGWLNAFLPMFFHQEYEEEPYWQMPHG